MRWILALLAFAAAAAAAYFLLAPPAPEAPAPRAAVAVLTPAPANPPSAPPSASAAPETPPAVLPPPQSSAWSAEQDQLARRALAGDGKAAARWREVDDTCRRIQAEGKPDLGAYFGDNLDALMSQPPRYAQISGEEHALLSDPRLETAKRQELAAEISLRLEALCKDYVRSDAAERYAIAETAARKGPPAAFWRFVQQPPLEPDDTGRRQQWRRSVTEQLQARSEKNDADAVFALGMAYAQDGRRGLPAMLPPNEALNAALEDDPVQAYRWLSLYVHMHADPRYTDQAQEWLAALGNRLDAGQRAEAEAWLADYRQRQARSGND
ncbi:hypothetical protein [Tahibacter harae]|uniref:DUF4034 domain-containing protein n=1 Tax=Tahibacter harae TaxID=2963937 RepID=A0ABT1QZG3_9GAMM|nr:hypothetical protein [Tahibacter harae]MCQ4167638.1 hypothetical protein [Tahibacter harae]